MASDSPSHTSGVLHGEHDIAVAHPHIWIMSQRTDIVIGGAAHEKVGREGWKVWENEIEGLMHFMADSDKECLLHS